MAAGGRDTFSTASTASIAAVVSSKDSGLIQQRLSSLLRDHPSRTAAASAVTALAFFSSWWCLRRMAQSKSRTADPTKSNSTKHWKSVFRRDEGYDPHETDPGLLSQNSEIKAFTTSRFTYPGVRVFFKRHTQLDQLPKDPAPLPLLVFVHGLGGSVVQFHPLLTSLTNIASCLAVDLPGCGRSDFAPTDWNAYTTDALVELLETIIDQHRDKAAAQGVILIGHSMGCGLSARLASKTSPHSTDLAKHVVGLVAICPPSGPPTEDKVNLIKKLLWVPGPVFDLWRAWDRRGGPESASVKRFVGVNADPEAKKLQDRFNNQSKTPVWRRMAWGAMPLFDHGVPKGGLPGKGVWSSLDVPIFLIGGADDNVTPPAEVHKILQYMNPPSSTPNGEEPTTVQPIVDAAAPVDTTVETAKPSVPAEAIEDITDDDFQRDKAVAGSEDGQEDPSTPQESPSSEPPPQPAHPVKVVESTIIPRGTHAMLYIPGVSNVLACRISDFLKQHVTGRLFLGWQLQYLSREGKWDVKNLKKWEKVAPVSESIAGVFRAIKTLREVDENHSPAKFVEKWGHTIKDVIDISHDNPVYDPAGLVRAGVRYHKFPTVSKIPPTDTEVAHFVALVDRLRAEQETRASAEGWDPKQEHFIGVHCHYGFNRTGYFIVCYLVERCGFETRKAIEAFAKARPNGIRHSHFLDRLYVRYAESDKESDA